MTVDVGHVFVVRGDLTKLSCDGIVIPRDGQHNVSSWVHELYGAPKPSVAYCPLPDGATLAPGRGPREARTVDTVTGGHTVDGMAEQVAEAVGQLGQTMKPDEGRVMPLIALPLPATGEGGLAHRRGAVVAALMSRLATVAADGEFDVALVLHDDRDFAAVQAHREFGEGNLTPTELEGADRLGLLAGAGALSIFAGAGISVPLGLPSWFELVKELSSRAGVVELMDEGDDARLKEIAQKAHDKLGDQGFRRVVDEIVATKHHALGHSLLASLGVTQNVTTNFDVAFDLALRAVHGEEVRVMTGEWALTRSPWLLKLHGSVGSDDGVVLTKKQYAKHARRGRPLYGLVQGLLMTSHLLFVGFSLTDSAYVKLARPVEDIYRKATRRAGGVATVLSLGPLRQENGGFDKINALHHLAFEEPGRVPAKAARALEIFLDRVSWVASRQSSGAHRYLLDERYSDLVSAADGDLKNGLKSVLAQAQLGGTETGQHVARLLAVLGTDSAP